MLQILSPFQIRSVAFAFPARLGAESGPIRAVVMVS
jgi:hypothetical protein